MSATGIAFGCIAAMLLWLPCFRAKDVFPFLEESLLRLEEKENEADDAVSSSEKRRVPDERRGIEEGWSAWSPWRTCSRSCDGGISISLRVCRGKCPEGEPVRRQICNMQPCPDASDFRASQCSGYNSQPYRERMYVWLPYYDPEDPCALTCQAEGYNFVAKHSDRVQDGTRCREGALDMCVNGQCQPIGCDLRVGSTLKVDECGMCGGDGSSCQRPTFVWQEESYGACSVTCGGGIQLSESTCRNKETSEQVDPRLCNLSIRPRTKAKHCNRHPCPVVWATGKWGPCSATCGSGVQSRPVFCVQGGPNGSRIDVKSEFCPRHKPLIERSCSVEECPRWFQGPWSACSVTCGHGVQTRAVVCRDTKTQYSELCDAKEMPRPQKPCEMPDPCPQVTQPQDNTTPYPCIYSSSTEEQTTTEDPTTPTEPVIYLTQAPANLTSSVHYFVGPWSRCNGQGFRRRVVHCQIFLEIAQTVARLPDTECVDIRPIDLEPCSVSCPPPFPSRGTEKEKEDLVEETTDANFYSWNTEKFSPCSASCSGGKHTSLVRCLRLPDEVEVSPQLCDLAVKPEPLTKKCNEQPCPKIYEWNITDFGECSKECGGGVRTRTVRCLSITDGVEVSAVRCPGQPPKALETCNVFDCEPAWKAEAWSKCSSSCSGGFQSRKLHCEKILAPLSQAVRLPADKCLKTRPKAVKKCNLKPCPPPPKPTTTTTTTTTTLKPTTFGRVVVDDDQDQSVFSEYEENSSVFVQKYPNRRVNLKASGQATLFKGSNAKFHCPLLSNSSRVLWFKGHLRIPPSTANGWPRVSVSGKGALRIHKITFADSGTYTCLAGAFRSDVRVRVKPLPTRQPEPGYFSDAGSFLATTPSSEVENRHRKLTNRSAMPQVRHFLVNMRHFSEERNKSSLLEYQWVVGEWSKCSQSCGGSGIQVRTIECRVTVLNSTKRDVPKALCADGGHPEPPTIRNCQLNPCPEWNADDWSECSLKNCLSWNTAYQKRGVLCEMANKTVTPSHCDSRRRPRRKRECYNPDCKGEWIVGQWSECTSSCGSKGFQSRRVQCAWRGSEEPAPPSACKGPPPLSTRACGRTPCKDKEEEGCYDQSTYCSVVKGTKLCEASQFRLQCCASCTDRKK